MAPERIKVCPGTAARRGPVGEPLAVLACSQWQLLGTLRIDREGQLRGCLCAQDRPWNVSRATGKLVITRDDNYTV